MIYSDFPILKKVIYLDNAATTLKPKSIIKKMSEFYLDNYANVHRGILPLMKYAKIKLSLKEQYILTHHASNVLGTIQDIKAIRDDNPNSIIAIDGSQYVPHNFPDLKKLDIDAYVFSGHKLLGPSGIGVVYLKNPKEWEPMLLGGGTV
jgi:cysteine desulfurase/selenocysteine lyase